jgi:NADP-dependent 3-hydroxy acid dehydrogenase YdfG
MTNIDGRVALVTGASSGIGRAIALAIASRGASVWTVGRRADALAETAAAAPDAELRPLPADLDIDGEVARILANVQSGNGTLDTVVHCAGTIALGIVEQADVADFDAQYRANLRAPFVLTQALLPMLKASSGDVVFVNSTAALGPRPGVGQYAATQAALRAITDSLRGEVNGDGIRVLSIFPGRTATPRQQRIHAIEGKDYVAERLMQPDDVAAMVVAALELPRTAEVTEIVMRPFVKPPT